MPGAGARARQKAKREAWLKNRPYPGFICRGCKHEDMMHFMWAGYCILENCDCQSMDDIKGENKQEYPQALPLPPKTPENTQINWTGF